MSARDEALRLARDARERAAKATPPPWESTPNDSVVMWHQSDEDPEPVRLSMGLLHAGDAEFVSHARDDVPELCDLMDALAAENERLAKQNAYLRTARDSAQRNAESESGFRQHYQREVTRQRAENARLRAALERIERWFGEFPPTGRCWDDGEPMSYSAAFGSHGERDYMREVARAALDAFARLDGKENG